MNHTSIFNNSITSPVKQSWRERRLLGSLIRRDIKLRYQGSLIGKYWNFIHPLALIIIYTVVFSKVMGAKIGGLAGGGTVSYTIYLCAGLLPWNAFMEVISRGTNSYLEYAHLIKKVSFPSNIIHLIGPGTATFNFLISMVFFIGLMVFMGVEMHPRMLMVIPLYSLQIAFTIGLSMTLAVLQVFFRDVSQFIAIILQLLFWGTPIVYIFDRIPNLMQTMVKLNPMYYFIAGYQDIFVYGKNISEATWLICSLLAGAGLLTGLKVVMMAQKDIPDEI